MKSTANPCEPVLSMQFGPVSRQLLVEWCAAENDYNPLYFDDRAAGAVGLSATPIQGTLRLALLGQLVTRWIDERGGGRLESISVRYRQQAFEGDTLQAVGTLQSVSYGMGGGRRVVLALRVKDGRGVVTTDGEAVVHLDQRE